jgi:AcrR family transcriptional regulator
MLSGFVQVGHRRRCEYRAPVAGPIAAIEGDGGYAVLIDSETSTQARPGRREQNKAEKRRRIVTAATKLFEERGFEATTTAAIAEEAGIGAGTLYLYVSSKEDLLVSVFRGKVGQAWDEAFALVDPAAPLLDQLLATFGHVTEYHEREPRLARAFFKELLFVSGAVRVDVTAYMRDFYQQLAGLLDQAQRNGLLAADVPTATLAQNLFSQWYVMMQRRHTREMTLDELLAEIKASFEVSVWGITPTIGAAGSDHPQP